MTPTAKQNGALKLLTDVEAPIAMKKMLLHELCTSDEESAEATLRHLLEAAAKKREKTQYLEKTKELAAKIEELDSGPLRRATFFSAAPGPGSSQRAVVVLPDGSSALVPVVEEALWPELRCGDDVWLSMPNMVLVFRSGTPLSIGEEARLERVIDEQRIEIETRDRGLCVIHTAHQLQCELAEDRAEPGSTIIYSSERKLGLSVVPETDGLARYRYLDRAKVPDVVIERDIGAPKPFLSELLEDVREELVDPAKPRRYGLRPLRTFLLAGVSGSGKTLSILGFHNGLAQVVSEVSGIPVADLPPMLVRMRASDMYSKWLGESEKQFDRFFDQVEELASRTITTASGEELVVPILIVCEEVDGVARARGGDPIYDRIQTTLLQRFDPTSQKIGEQLAIVFLTSNVAHLVDTAMLRRSGGQVIEFDRLGRGELRAVLAKHLAGLPFARENGESNDAARERVVAEMVGWLFDPQGPDQGQVELVYAGRTDAITKYRRDFLTGGLVDRAVQQAAADANRAERNGAEQPGLCTAGLVHTFSAQVGHAVRQLTPENAESHLTLPQGSRVASVRRIEQRPFSSIELQRAQVR